MTFDCSALIRSSKYLSEVKSAGEWININPFSVSWSDAKARRQITSKVCYIFMYFYYVQFIFYFTSLYKSS